MTSQNSGERKKRKTGGSRGEFIFYINFSRFCKLNRATSINNTDPVARMILFLTIIIPQVASFTSQGMLYGFRKIFHWLLFRKSLRIMKNSPKMIIITAVPFPFLTTVDNMNDIMARKKTGIITWAVIFTKRNFTIRIDDTKVKTSIIRKAIAIIRIILTSHTLYL